MYVYNCHTHLFNLDCTPNRFLGGFAGGWFGKVGARLLQGLLAVPVGKKLTLRLANQFPFARKYAAFLKIGTSLSPLAMFEQELMPAYPAGTRFVVLPINFDLMGAGTATLNQESQLWQLLEVRKRYPNTCLPFVSMDPRQGTAAENRAFVERWMNRGFVGIKLYPGLGFYPFDARLDGVYAFAEEHGLPVMTHCSRGGIYYQGPITPAFRNPDLPVGPNTPLPNPLALYGTDFPLRRPDKESNDTFCDFFLDPRAYQRVLDRYPKLKLCLAHYGGSEEVAAFPKSTNPTPANPTDPLDNWYAGVRDLMTNYDNVYTDVSYTLADNALFPTLAQDVLTPAAGQKVPYQERVLFGTDFFMSSQEKAETQLATELMNDLLNRANSPTAWQQIANTNPVKYLQSTFYTP